MVRRLGRGLGGSLGRAGRFRPVGSGRRRALDQCMGALGDREGSQVVCSTSSRFLSGGLRRQFASRVVSAEPRRDSFFFSELHRSEDSPLGGGSVSSDFPTVYYGETQCPGRRSFSPKLDLGLRVDAEAGGLRGSAQERWPVSINLFATSQNHRCSLYFSPYHDHNALGTDALLQNWNGWQAYAFPPWCLIPAVLKKLRSSSGVILTIVAPYWPQRPGFLDLVVDGRSLCYSPETFCVSPTSTGFIWECPGCVFMLGDYQAIHLHRWILQECSSAGVLSTSAIFACGLSV